MSKNLKCDFEVEESYSSLSRNKNAEAVIKAFANSATGVAFLDGDGIIIGANPAFWTVVGNKHSNCNVLSLISIVHPDDAGKVNRLIHRIVDGLLPNAELETHCIRGPLEAVPLRIQFSLFHESDEDAPGVIILVEDVSHLAAQEGALKEEEAKFKTVADTMPAGLYIYSGQKYVYANPAAMRVTGYAPEELIGMNILDVVHPDHRAMVAKYAEARRLGKKAPTRYELKLITKSGEDRWADVTVGPVTFRGEPALLLTAFDITDRKRAEFALKKSEERYREIFEESLTGDYVCRPEGSIIACNRAFAGIFGFSSVEEVLKCDMWSLYRDATEKARLLDLLEEHGRVERYEVEFRGRDGGIAYVIQNAVGVFDQHGRLTEIKGYLFDDTARRLLEQQLNQSQKMEAIGRLAGGIAHDFNNILTAIIGHSQLILRHTDRPDRLQSEAEHVLQSARRAADLTGKLLAFSRNQLLRPSVLDLNEVVRNMTPMLERVIGEDVELTTKLDPDLRAVRTDPVQIEQVIMNLAINARDSMPDGGCLVVETRNTAEPSDPVAGTPGGEPAAQVMLAVSDTGCGMEDETQKHVFEPFFTTKESGKGTGLGLSTVYGIVKQSGGQIHFTSAPGRGTTFRIYLPRADRDAEALPSPANSHRLPTGTETILIAEDDPQVRNLAKVVLQEQGYTVLTASDGQAALELLLENAETEIHLLLTDLVMPKLNGREVADAIKVLRPDMKVLFTSGYPVEADGRRLADDLTAFLRKPYTPASLSQRVREVLDSPQQQ